MDQDAAVLDGPKSKMSKENLTEYGWLLHTALSGAMKYSPKAKDENANHFAEMQDIYGSFDHYVSYGDPECKRVLEMYACRYVPVYEASIKAASEADTAAPGVMIVDVRDFGAVDFGVIDNEIVKLHPNTVITGYLKSDGPIGAKFGKQISISVITSFQKRVNLLNFKPAGLPRSPDTAVEDGCISNAPFMAHYSQAVFEALVLPKLAEHVASVDTSVSDPE